MSQSGFRRGIVLAALSLILAIMSVSCTETLPELKDGLYANFTTSKGTIIVKLFPDEAPLTVMNFVGLAEGDLNFAEKKGRFYDGLTFHRVVEDFMIQGGDPKGNGTGGPGYSFQDETDNGLRFEEPGFLAMANSGPNTNGSQFFITHVPTPWLDGKHTIFGKVVVGQDIVDSVEQGDVIEKLKILRIGSIAKPYKADTDTFKEMQSNLQTRRKAAQEEAMKVIMNDIANRWPDAVRDEGTGIYSVIRNEGTGSTPPQGTPITVHYTGTLIDGTQFDSSRDRNEPFQFNVGSGQVIPGWDATLLQMKKGERRIVILPPEMAYGERGIGPIPPNSWLVFDIELLDF